jgi:hypothetical protein
MGWVKPEVGIIILVFAPIYLIWEIFPWAARQVNRRPSMSLAIFVIVGAALGGTGWLAIRKYTKPPSVPSQGAPEIGHKPPLISSAPKEASTSQPASQQHGLTAEELEAAVKRALRSSQPVQSAAASAQASPPINLRDEALSIAVDLEEVYDSNDYRYKTAYRSVSAEGIRAHIEEQVAQAWEQRFRQKVESLRKLFAIERYTDRQMDLVIMSINGEASRPAPKAPLIGEPPALGPPRAGPFSLKTIATRLRDLADRYKTGQVDPN